MAGVSLARLLEWSLILLLTVMFALAATPKILDPVAFASSIEAYRLISGSPVNWVALFLPWLELTIAVGLLTPWLRRASATTIAGLLTTFIALHVVSWARGLDISCGCFGEGTESSNYALLIARNSALLIAVLFILWTDSRKRAKI